MPATKTPLSNSPVRTILLVEDEDSVREITRCVLESAGYLVLEASGPEDAIAIFQRFEGSISLLLTDVVMPVMSGAELAAQLKHARPGLIAMFMSGYATNAGLQCGFDSADWYLQKPFTTATLLSRVAEALSLPPGTRRPAPDIRLPI
jgi:two-component system cell cycle sensor histidine kinase/response regulator CckA